ncbi:MAG: class I SAM-dependent methyltransferase [Candidatus Binataceae bacterium]
MGDLETSRQFWDEKAKENAYWFISSAGPYEGRNLDEFWASGTLIWNDLKRATGYRPEAGHLVVEIGCGIGRLTRAIAPEVGQVDAFDISGEMLKKAQSCVNATNVTFRQSETPELPEVPGACADAFVAYCVFQHLPSIDVLAAYLQTAARVLKPGGMLIFTMSPRTWRDNLAAVMRARLRLVELRARGGPRGLYKTEWYGVRPPQNAIQGMCSIQLKRDLLHGDKWLFFGRR